MLDSSKVKGNPLGFVRGGLGLLGGDNGSSPPSGGFVETGNRWRIITPAAG
jgi:hypothetical protein